MERRYPKRQVIECNGNKWPVYHNQNNELCYRVPDDGVYLIICITDAVGYVLC